VVGRLGRGFRDFMVKKKKKRVRERLHGLHSLAVGSSSNILGVGLI
jgi:hypothetical protein